MTRRTKLLLFGGGLLAAAVAIALAFRAPLLETVLRAALQSRGLASLELSVENLGWDEVTLANLSLGSQGEVRVERITATYRPIAVISGQIDSVTLEGAILTLDLTGTSPPLGSLQPLLTTDAGDGTGAPPPLPALLLRDGQVNISTPLGAISGPITGQLRPVAGGALDASLAFDLEGAGGQLRGTAKAERGQDGRTQAQFSLDAGYLTLTGPDLGERIPRRIALRGIRAQAEFTLAGSVPENADASLTLDELEAAGMSFARTSASLRLDGDRLDIDAKLPSADGELFLGARAGIMGFPDAPAGEVFLETALGPKGALWTLLPVPPPATGNLRASLTLSGVLPTSLKDLYPGDAGKALFSPPPDLTHTARLQLKNLGYPPLIQGLSGDLRLEIPATAPGESVTATLSGSLEASGLKSGQISARQLKVHQPLVFELNDQELLVSIQETGIFSAKAFALGDLVKSDGPIRVELSSSDAPIAVVVPPIDAGHVRNIDLTFEPGPLRLMLSRAPAEDLSVSAEARALRVTGEYRRDRGFAGRIELEGGSATVPHYEIAVEKLHGVFDLAPEGENIVRAEVGALRHLAEPALVAPLSASGEARLFGDAVSFDAAADGPDNAGHLTLSGRHSLESGEGTAQIRLDPLRFVPGGLQPGTLLPGFAALRDVTGQASAQADISWGVPGLAGTATLGFDEVSFENETARVEGLSLALALDQLGTPGSAPGQSFTVRRIDPGVPVEDLKVDFQVLPSDPTSVAIAAAEFGFAGGKFSFQDVVVTGAGEHLDLPVQVDGLDLGELFALLGVEGLSGEGSLSGSLPLAVDEGIPAISNGRLSAQGPGRLRVHSEQVRQTLSAAGESADLLVRALEDFHYEELTLSVDQPSADRALVRLSLLGNNPTVLDGYPFRFNISLETDPRKLLAALQEAFRISDRALRQVWMFRR